MKEDQQFSKILSSFSDETSTSAPSAAARILDSMRRRIIMFDLPPDTVLSRIDLAEEYGVSQTPVRDALQKLETEGLVQIFPQSKTIVTRIDPGKIAEALFLRRAIEIQVVRVLAESITKETLSRLKTIVSLQETVAEQDEEIGTFQDLDESFHQTMIAATGFPNLHQLIRSKSGHLNRLRRLDMWDAKKLRRVIKDHKAILGALEARDAEAAAQEIRRHLGQTIGQLDRLQSKHPDYFKA